MMQGQPPSLDDCSSSCNGCSGSFDDCRGSSDDCNGSRDDCNGSCDGGNGSTNQDKPDRPSRPTLQEMLQWLKANRKGMVLPVASMLILAAVLGFASVYEFGGASGMADPSSKKPGGGSGRCIATWFWADCRICSRCDVRGRDKACILG